MLRMFAFALAAAALATHAIAADAASIDELKLRIATLVASTQVDTAATSTVDDSDTCPLIVTVAERGCGPCEAWERVALPELAAEGWRYGRHYTIRRVPLGSEPTPTFAWEGETFAPQGFTGWLAWRSELCDAMGVEATAGVVSGRPPAERSGAANAAHTRTFAAPAAVQLAPGERLVAVEGRSLARQLDAVDSWSAPAMVPPDPRPGHWTFPGDIDSHLRSHGIDPRGMTYEQKLTAHDLAHEQGWRPSRGYAMPAQRTYYAAPARGPVRRVMGTVFGSCPLGGCP